MLIVLYELVIVVFVHSIFKAACFAEERLVQASPGIKASDVPQSRGSLDADEYPDELPTIPSVLLSQNTLAEQLVLAQSGQAGIRVSNESLSRGFLPPEEYPDHVEPTTPGNVITELIYSKKVSIGYF